jgi:hypothetical protein
LRLVVLTCDCQSLINLRHPLRLSSRELEFSY